MSRLDDILAQDGTAAENSPTPAGGSRPRQSRSTVFSIRLNPEELAELQHRANQEGVPARTLARAFILNSLRKDGGNLDARVRRLEDVVFKRSA